MPFAVLKRSLLLSSIAVIVGGAALAGGVYLRDYVDASPGEIVRVKQAVTDRSAAVRRPEFFLADAQGVRHGIAEWDGKLLVINFWATWCPPCLHEIPMFIRLQERYRSRSVQFLGIAIDDADNVREFAESVGLNYPTLLGQLDAIEVMSAYGNASGGLPFTVFVDASGMIVARHAGVLDEAKTGNIIEDLL
jgi:thiol-disulfide isomerase/thioredoxin